MKKLTQILKNKNFLFSLISIVFFLLVSVVYNYPVLLGKKLIQPDIVHYKGGAEELLQYRENHHEETYWSNSMFGGMPTYQSGAAFKGDLIKKIDECFNFLPKPANYLFLLFAGFYFLAMVVVRNWKFALLGALFYGFSTYFFIIIAAGHNGKVHTIAYFAPLLASILLVFQRKYLLGFGLTALFMGLELVANHLQMTFYFFFAVGFLFISQFIYAIIEKKLKHFFISLGILSLAFGFGITFNSQRIMANMEYVKETVRGKKILLAKDNKPQAEGMDKSSITMWSYGKLESFNLFIPRFMGGSSSSDDGNIIMQNLRESVQSNARSEKEVEALQNNLGSLTYWGDQPGTSGPAYQGALIVFLGVLGFFFISKKYKYWLLASLILTLMLAWGENFALLTDFFIDYMPMYNKFRAPSSILVVSELILPLVALMGVYQFLKSENTAQKTKIFYYVSGFFVTLLVVFILLGKSVFAFANENELKYLPTYALETLQDGRFALFRTDSIKALFYLLLAITLLYFYQKEKIKTNAVLIGLGLISLFDLWTVNKNYLNESNYVDKVFAENPFPTESDDVMLEKSQKNPYIAGLVGQTNVNKVLETIKEKDTAQYRIFNFTLSPFNESNTSYFKSSVGGYHAVKLRRYDDLIDAYFSNGISPEILNLLNTKYVIQGDANQPEVAMNPEANGNAWFVSDLKFVTTPNEELSSLAKINNKKTAVISETDKAYFQGKNIDADSTAYIKLSSYKPNKLKYNSKSRTNQLAVFSEIYYPKGWNFYIDGKKVDYLKADYLLRAVYVPSGSHTIEMKFEPEVIQKGKLISMASLGIFILLMALGYFYQRKLESKNA